MRIKAALSILLLCVLTSSASPQTDAGKNSSIHKSVGGFWRVDGGFRAQLRITNSDDTSTAAASPVLFMQDGTAYPLAKVVVPTGGVVLVDVNDALNKAPMNVISHLSSLGSATVEYSSPYGSSINVAIENIDVKASLVFDSMFAPDSAGQALNASEKDTPKIIEHNIEGLWWKEFEDVQTRVALVNTSLSSVDVDIKWTSPASGALTKHVTIGAHETAITTLEDRSKAMASGGVSVRYKGTERSVIAVGMLEDDAKGYSATMAFTYPSEHKKPQAVPVQYSSAGIMVGRAANDGHFRRCHISFLCLCPQYQW